VSGVDDFLAEVFRASGHDARLTAQAARAACAEAGHQYQVHGKTTPTRIVCARCKVSWAVGPRTEPA